MKFTIRKQPALQQQGQAGFPKQEFRLPNQNIPGVNPAPSTQVSPRPAIGNVILPQKVDSKDKLRLIPIGGIGDVTKNMYLYEYQNDIIIIDCGVGFPDEAMLGIDLVIPDFSYLRNKKEKIRGIIISHGHDDHIGALPYFLKEFPQVPVFASKLAAGLISVELKEHRMESSKIFVFDPAQSLNFGSFNLQFYRVNHSIPDALGIVIKTPVGVIIHQADFKFDWTPVNQPTIEAGKIAQFGQEGVLALLTDCLRVEKPGYTLSEKMIEETFSHVVENSPGRVFITTTSSNVSRIQQAVNIAQKYGRYVVFAGRSMENNIEIAQRLNYLKIPHGLALDIENIKRVPDRSLLIIAAGSQGQSGSSLSRMAHGHHKFVNVRKGDVIIFSSDPIPSTGSAVHAVIDTLTKVGATVFYSDILDDLHVSGHAASEEIKLLISLVKAKYLVPIGGGFRHMRHFSNLAQSMGYKQEEIYLLEDGQVVEFETGKGRLGEKIEIKNVMVDGLGVGDVGNLVLRDRQAMAEDGIVVVIVPVDQALGQIAGEPDIISRGFVFMKESESLMNETKVVVKKCLAKNKGRVSDWHFLRREIENSLESFLYTKTQRHPMILTVVVEV